jgi:hypothetical protein
LSESGYPGFKDVQDLGWRGLFSQYHNIKF